MKYVVSCLKKDFRLFFSNIPGAVLSLLLPILVFVFLFSGGKELMSASASIQPFAVAVRDEDQTFMSRTLIEQLRAVELFSEVVDAKDRSDSELFFNDAAAVITIPRDFFYLAYDMQSEVRLSLNANMPAEASIVKELSVTVLNLMTENQIAAQVTQELQGLDVSSDAAKAEAARSIFRDAFSLLDMMQSGTAIQAEADSITVMLVACVLSLFCMLIPLQVASTLIEDKATGILPRYTAAGGSVIAVVVSKLLSALLLTGIPVFATCLILFRDRAVGLLTVAACLFLCAFGVALLFASLSHRAERMLLWGNLYVLVALLFGGTIYPISVMPDTLSWLRYIMLPYYALRGTQTVFGQWQSGMMLSMLPVLILGALCLLCGTVCFCRKGARA